MFVEFSKGGSLQKSMKEVLDRLAPMLGFKVSVTEKGGSALGSLLSNKNLWKGEHCGRPNCRTCAQPGDKKEPCKARNVVYESECTLCNEPGSRKEADRESLKEPKEQANLYVGETARSISERAGEHWEGAIGGKEENHMMEHLASSHREEQLPSFRFRVVKQCRTALERQVREAVRIEMRGNILNKKGMFNRCKLTRMVVDTEWDKKVWEEAWATKPEEEENLEGILGAGKTKSSSDGKRAGKRLKREDEGIVWGEQVSEDDRAREDFLKGGSNKVAGGAQSELKVYRGVEWLMRSIIIESSHRAVEYADLVGDVKGWEEWDSQDSSRPTTEDAQISNRTDREEKFWWYILNELDKDEFKNEKMKQAKKARTIAKARIKMNAGKSQPSISEMLKSSKPPQSNSLATLTVPVVIGADTGSAYGTRPGWKSSQAGAIGRVSEPVIISDNHPTSISRDGENTSKPANSKVPSINKPESEGGSRANAYTGTMCNIVMKSASKDVENTSSPASSDVENTSKSANPEVPSKNIISSVCDKQVSSNVSVDQLRCVKARVCAKYVSGDVSVDQLTNVPPATAKPNVTIKNECGKITSFTSTKKNVGCKPKVSFSVQNISKGKFKLETTNGGPASGSSQPIRNLATNKQTATLKNKTYKHTNVGTGTFSRGSVTPSKRKTIDGGGEGGEVKTLICIFESDITKPTWQDISLTESPAKRQRCGRQRSK
jgi:hypothetical protein